MSRSNTSKFGVIAVLLALAGCGGGGGGSSPPTGSISGTVTSFATGAPLAQVSVDLRGAGSGAPATDVNGAYSSPGLAAGSYTTTPSLDEATLSPASRSVSVSGAASSGEDF